MRRRPGRFGRPFEEMDEKTLFRLAFPDGWEGMRRVAAEGESAGGPMRERWEAVLELARRVLSSPPPRSEPVRSAADVYERYRYLLADSPVEVFLVVLLDVKHRLSQDACVSVGILNGSLIHPREVFATAVAKRAASIVLVHNHPSGDPFPSPEDREVTQRLRSAGEIVGIPVLDHVIIGSCSFYSFREEGNW
jgi:DNA repair protein RadC